MYKKISLKRLSNKTLAKMFLRQLYLWYDLSGISMGRSHRSFLLEMTQFLAGRDLLKDINRDRSCHEFLNAAQNRISKRGNKKIMPFKKLGLVKNYSLAYLLIRKLRAWVRSAKGRQEYRLTPTERKMIEATLKLMELGGFGVSGFFYAKELMNEASKRQQKIWRMINARRFNQDLPNRLT